MQPALPTVLANMIGSAEAVHLEVMAARDGVALLGVRDLGVQAGPDVLAVDGQAEVARQEPNRLLDGQWTSPSSKSFSRYPITSTAGGSGSS